MTTMDPEKVTVTISSSAGEDAPLSVEDAMNQILDFFGLLSAAGGVDSDAISWKLVDISMNSPLQATAIAVSNRLGVEAATIARREKALLAHSFDDIVRQEKLPDWITGASFDRARSFLRRNTTTIGRTDIQFHSGAPISTISSANATIAFRVLENVEQKRVLDSAKIAPWIEYGSIEGIVYSITLFYGNPAIIVKERISGEEITCVASPKSVEEGSRHTWSETWSNKRVIVTGEISYRGDGRISKVTSADFEIVDPRSVTFDKISDTNFTGGLSPTEYLDFIWRDTGG